MEFRFHLSSEVNANVRVKIESLIGNKKNSNFLDAVSYGMEDLLDSSAGDSSGIYIVAEIYSMGRSLTSSARTPYRTFLPDVEKTWSLWLTFPIRYRDLPLDSQLCFTVHDLKRRSGRPFGGTTCSLFTRHGTIRQGKQKLRVFPDTEPDVNFPSITDGRMPKNDRDVVAQLDKKMKRFEMNQLPHVHWLDVIVLKQISAMSTLQKNFSDEIFLRIELRTTEHPIVFDEPYVERGLQKKDPLVMIPDFEINQHDNPIETKYRKLSRSRGMASTDWKPNAQEMKRISQVIDYPPTTPLKGEDQELVWKYRFAICSQKRALTKFLKCVDFADEEETKQAIDLMHRWAAIDVEDALELLSNHFINEQVRSYAVGRLGSADDRDLQDYLLQLVQALAYEKSTDSRLARFIIKRGVDSPLLGNYLHWYLVVASEDKKNSRHYMEIHQKFLDLLSGSPEGKERVAMLRRQDDFIASLSRVVRDLKGKTFSRAKKIEYMRQEITTSGGSLHDLLEFQPLALPLHPEVEVVGLIPEKCSIFKSALSPLNLKFRVGEVSEIYGIVFKHGDDMRQDQLIIQMVSLMDRLLKKEGLDLCLTPYRVLATSYRDGISQFVPSRNLSHVLQENKNDIRRFLRGSEPEVRPEVLDVYVRSCAGYCVITYLLGIGDRHLDNLMLCESGNLFHIDFGYILGRDPKPFPPPMKLCKEMVEAMGGYDSQEFHKFKTFCCEAFNILRKSANLILTLFILMVDANIPDLREEPDKCILKVQERFRLDLDDEKAVQFFQSLITESVKALFPQMFETIHRWAQYWRS